MPEILTPDTTGKLLADLESRVRALEVVQRTGLASIRTAWGTASVDPVTFGAWETGAAGTTWTDDRGNTGTGYCTLTAATGARALVVFGARVIGLASGAPFRSNQATVGVGWAGLNPALIPGPTGQRTAFVGGNASADFNIVHVVPASNLTPGNNQFVAWANWVNTVPAGTFLPRMTDVVLAVIPISPAPVV